MPSFYKNSESFNNNSFFQQKIYLFLFIRVNFSYLPEAVNIAIGNARYVPAMCYISWEMEQGFLIGRIDFSDDFLYCCFFPGFCCTSLGIDLDFS